MRSGRFGEAIPSLELAVRAEPYREGLWELLVTALYQAGRQNDALSTVRRVRRLLRDDLGVDLGPALVDLERRVLAHELAPVAAGRAPLHLAPDLATHVAGATWTTKDNDDARLVLPDGTERKIGETPVTIGRHERCEVVLGHRDVSRRHAILALIDGTRLLSDLGSTNGTLLNGHPVGADPQPVVHGDRIEVGPIVLRYETGPGARREATWSTVASAPKTR